MLMSSKLAPTIDPVLGESRLSDIAPIFNLIQNGSLNGHFSNLYTRPRYMAGLGIQLFSLCKNGRIKLPDGTWHQAKMKVLRVGGDFAGFVILRHDAHQPAESEIYMCGLENDFRGQGLGEWLLGAALSEVPVGHTVFADCLPNSVQMKTLLMKLRFDEVKLPASAQISSLARRFAYHVT
ncbi:MAG: GNAT family N-acetyltransferase [Proteobacteria bacterium]|nr:GNAT family N-acetyltransferase [Pseudomonadota bacterium]